MAINNLIIQFGNFTMTYYHTYGKVDLPISYTTTSYKAFVQPNVAVYNGVLAAVVYRDKMEKGSFQIYGDYSDESLANVPNFWFTIGY